jgi:hypothetical protein
MHVQVQTELRDDIDEPSMGAILRTRRVHLSYTEFSVRNNRFSDYMRATGFYDIWQLSAHKVDNALITALVERWRIETHTFHLPEGEMSITLQDVQVGIGITIYLKIS